MIQRFLFNITQLLYVKSAMGLIAAYRPNGKTPVLVDGMVTAARGIKDVYLEKVAVRNSGRAALQVSQDAGHAAVVKVYAMMKSVYTSDEASWQRIVQLPKNDQSAARTLERMGAASKLWAALPNPPGQATPFTAGGLTRAQFDLLLADLTTKYDDSVQCEQEFQKASADLHVLDRSDRAFIAAALTQGRAQFAPGTWEREMIDAIPTAAGTQPPGQVVISLAESTGAGAVHLQFDGPRATSFQVWHKGPEDESFALVTEVIRPGPSLPGDYSATDLASGAHEYQVVGVNSRGEGAASVASTVEVGGAAPAQGAITFAESQAEGAVHLFYEAEGATSYQVWHKGPSEPGFTQVGTTITGEYVVFGLAGGMHAYKIAGVNDQGTGALSEPVSLDVAEAEAA